MEEIVKLSEIRDAICFAIGLGACGEVEQMSDENLLKCHFKEDFDLDSMDIVEITLCIENAHEVDIPNSEIEYVLSKGTVRAMYERYNELLGQ